jgi:hypothetical protein
MFVEFVLTDGCPLLRRPFVTLTGSLLVVILHPLNSRRHVLESEFSVVP